jgi:hypothetical protein
VDATSVENLGEQCGVRARPCGNPSAVAKLEELSGLVGTWSLTGRTLGADADDISGTVTVRWAADELALVFEGDQTIQSSHFRTLEVIWYDDTSDSLRAHVYGGDAPIDYRWDVAEDGTIVHAGLGSTYRGTFSDDGATLAGGWRPDPGSGVPDDAAYDATMRRVD